MVSFLGNKEVMAKNIQFYMDKNGINRRKLSADLNVSYTTLTDWLKGKTYPRIDKIELLANYFKINKSDLVENRDEIDQINLEKGLIAKAALDMMKLSDERVEKVYEFIQFQLMEQNNKGV